MIKLRNSGLTSAVVALAVAMPATASARILDQPANGGGEPASIAASEVHPSITSNGGFAWDDAGVGAGAALLVVGLGAGLAGTPGRRHGRRLSATGS